VILREFTHWYDIECILERQGRTEEDIMRRRAEITAKRKAIAMYRKASEWAESEDGKRQMIQPEDLRELQPVTRLTDSEERAITLRMAAMSGAVERGDTWTRWQWISWGAPWLATGLILGAAIVTAVKVAIP
jgi:hypothetical protein